MVYPTYIEGTFKVSRPLNARDQDDLLDFSRDEGVGCPIKRCHWVYNSETQEIEWDGDLNFPAPYKWIKYLIDNVFEPHDILLDGIVKWKGGSDDDNGIIDIEGNDIILKQNGKKIDLRPPPIIFPSHRRNAMAVPSNSDSYFQQLVSLSNQTQSNSSNVKHVISVNPDGTVNVVNSQGSGPTLIPAAPVPRNGFSTISSLGFIQMEGRSMNDHIHPSDSDDGSMSDLSSMAEENDMGEWYVERIERPGSLGEGYVERIERPGSLGEGYVERIERPGSLSEGYVERPGSLGEEYGEGYEGLIERPGSQGYEGLISPMSMATLLAGSNSQMINAPELQNLPPDVLDELLLQMAISQSQAAISHSQETVPEEVSGDEEPVMEEDD